MPSTTEVVVTGLLGGGGAAMIGAFFQGLTAYRAGVKADERDAARETGHRLKTIQRDLRYFQLVAAGYATQLRAARIEPSPAVPIPPSERSNGNGLSSPAQVITEADNGGTVGQGP
jgi:hypothetical protein